ncbi:hypothetical protein F4806DRAFT_485042 [Annulohypoxylon nitens]|nr:hypothetical protein F4806DRAFT_485042 [Annulohypoxylon nitens]
MCYQLIERFSDCHCLYYQHAVDRCPDYGKLSHHITTRTILVGYACTNHSRDDNYRINTINTDNSSGTQIPKPDQKRSLSENVYNAKLDAESQSESDSSELWDNESNASLSSISTVDPDVIAVLFQKLANYGNLRWFWPKVIARNGTMKRGCHSVERFLRRYAEDLGTWAYNPINDETASDADRRVKLSASCFIRRSRFKLAENICRMHRDRTLTSESLLNQSSEYESMFDTIEREEEEAEEQGFNYSLAEEFLFETEPIRRLESNIYIFLQSSQPQSFPNIILGTAEQCLDKFLDFFQRPSLTDGKRRLSWKSKCGQIVHDDYIELRPGALDRLQELLHQYGKTQEYTGLNDAENVPNSSTKGGTFPRFSFQRLRASLSNKNNPQKLPCQRQDKVTCSKFGVCSKPSVGFPMHHIFILMCVPFRRWGTKLRQEDICDIKSDRQFFQALNYFYNVQRGRSNWARPNRVVSINFVQFELFRSCLVDVKLGVSIPPTGQLNSNYEFEPVDSFPPIGSNMLMHLFSHPEDADALPVLYSRIPKKLRLRLEACPVKGSAVGWGVQFVEGLNWSVLFGYGCMGFAICLAAAISWTIARDDVQGGFSIAGFMVAFCMFCVGVIGHGSKLDS